MSSNQLERIKGIRKFLGNNSSPSFDSFIPFGTEGNLVDVFSGLDLEQELILGSNKKVSFNTNTNEQGIITTSITQKFQDDEQTCIYTKVTLIQEIPIIDAIEGQSENSVIGDNNSNLVIGNFRGRNKIIIYMYLYNGEYFTEEEKQQILNDPDLTEQERAEIQASLISYLVHQKRILIKSDQIIEELFGPNQDMQIIYDNTEQTEEEDIQP